MYIYYIGNFTQPHCTEVHLAKTLEDMDHKVIRAQENELAEQWAGDLLTNKPDLVLYTRTWGDFVLLRDIEYLRANGITTASYHLDLYVGLARKYLHQGRSLEEILRTDPFWQTDYVFTPDGDRNSAKVFAANGVKHYYIKPGVFKDECKSALKPAEDKMIDVLFVGGGDYPGSPHGYGHPEWPYRDQLIQWLSGTYGERFTKYGHPQPTVRNEALNELYASARVVVGDSVCLDFKHENYWSDRVYETIGRGGFIIHPCIKGMDQEFTDGENIVFYKFGEWDELKAKVDHFTNPENEAERQRIQQAGQAYVRDHCTYHNRLQQALAIIGRPGNQIIIDEAATIDWSKIEAAAKNIDNISAKKINLGAGREPDLGPDWVNVDLLPGEGIDVTANLLHFPYPFDSDSAEYIKAIDLLEHLPNYTPDYRPTVIAFVEECHRILKPGGELHIQVPHFASPNMWIDPTHVRGFDPKSFDYFDPTTDFGTWYGYYSECKFRVTCEVQTWPDGAPNNLTFRMVKI